MSRICRLCLKTTPTYISINQKDNTGVTTSTLARTLVPELYLGVSLNPVVCQTCYQRLREAYVFRLQCLRSENLIGIYIRESKNTHSSIVLEEVVNFWIKHYKSKPEEVQGNLKEWFGTTQGYDCYKMKPIILNQTTNINSPNENTLDELFSVLDSRKQNDSASVVKPSAQLESEKGNAADDDPCVKSNTEQDKFNKEVNIDKNDKTANIAEPLNKASELIQPQPPGNTLPLRTYTNKTAIEPKKSTIKARKPEWRIKVVGDMADKDINRLIGELKKDENLQKLGFAKAQELYVLEKTTDESTNSKSFAFLPKAFVQKEGESEANVLAAKNKHVISVQGMDKCTVTLQDTIEKRVITVQNVVEKLAVNAPDAMEKHVSSIQNKLAVNAPDDIDKHVSSFQNKLAVNAPDAMDKHVSSIQNQLAVIAPDATDKHVSSMQNKLAVNAPNAIDRYISNIRNKLAINAPDAMDKHVSSIQNKLAVNAPDAMEKHVSSIQNKLTVNAPDDIDKHVSSFQNKLAVNAPDAMDKHVSSIQNQLAVIAPDATDKHVSSMQNKLAVNAPNAIDRYVSNIRNKLAINAPDAMDKHVSSIQNKLAVNAPDAMEKHVSSIQNKLTVNAPDDIDKHVSSFQNKLAVNAPDAMDKHVSSIQNQLAVIAPDATDKHVSSMQNKLAVNAPNAIDRYISNIRNKLAINAPDAMDKHVSSIQNKLAVYAPDAMDKHISSIQNKLAVNAPDAMDKHLSSIQNKLAVKAPDAMDKHVSSIQNKLAVNAPDAMDKHVSSIQNKLAVNLKKAKDTHYITVQDIIDKHSILISQHVDSIIEEVSTNCRPVNYVNDQIKHVMEKHHDENKKCVGRGKRVELRKEIYADGIGKHEHKRRNDDSSKKRQEPCMCTMVVENAPEVNAMGTAVINVQNAIDKLVVNALNNMDKPDNVKETLYTDRIEGSTDSIVTDNTQTSSSSDAVQPAKDIDEECLGIITFPPSVEELARSTDALPSTSGDKPPSAVPFPLIRVRPVSSLQKVRTLNHELWPQNPASQGEAKASFEAPLYRSSAELFDNPFAGEPIVLNSKLAGPVGENLEIHKSPPQMKTLMKTYAKKESATPPSKVPKVMGHITYSQFADLYKTGKIKLLASPNPLEQRIIRSKQSALDKSRRLGSRNIPKNRGGAYVEPGEDVIDIKDEPLDVEEDDVIMKFDADGGGESTRSASETSFMDSLAPQMDIIPELGEDQYDMPEYVQIQKVDLVDYHRMLRESKVPGKNFAEAPEDSGCSAPLRINPVRLRTHIPDMIKGNEQAINCLGSISAPGIKSGRCKRATGKRLRLIQVDANGMEVEGAAPKLRRLAPRSILKSNVDTIAKRLSVHSRDDRNVCVLYTNFTGEGDYINDHDYLVNPYIRNHLSFRHKGFNGPVCVCLLCNVVHQSRDHIDHMKSHGTVCKVCQIDFHNVFILNLHVRGHEAFCPECKIKVSYSDHINHAQLHNRSLALSNIALPSEGLASSGSTVDLTEDDRGALFGAGRVEALKQSLDGPVDNLERFGAAASLRRSRRLTRPRHPDMEDFNINKEESSSMIYKYDKATKLLKRNNAKIKTEPDRTNEEKAAGYDSKEAVNNSEGRSEEGNHLKKDNKKLKTKRRRIYSGKVRRKAKILSSADESVPCSDFSERKTDLLCNESMTMTDEESCQDSSDWLEGSSSGVARRKRFDVLDRKSKRKSSRRRNSRKRKRDEDEPRTEPGKNENFQFAVWETTAEGEDMITWQDSEVKSPLPDDFKMNIDINPFVLLNNLKVNPGEVVRVRKRDRDYSDVRVTRQKKPKDSLPSGPMARSSRSRGRSGLVAGLEDPERRGTGKKYKKSLEDTSPSKSADLAESSSVGALESLQLDAGALFEASDSKSEMVPETPPSSNPFDSSQCNPGFRCEKGVSLEALLMDCAALDKSPGEGNVGAGEGNVGADKLFKGLDLDASSLGNDEEAVEASTGEGVVDAET